MRKNLTLRVTDHWEKLPGEVVDFPSLEVFKTSWMLSSATNSSELALAESWTPWLLVVPSKPCDSVPRPCKSSFQKHFMFCKDTAVLILPDRTSCLFLTFYFIMSGILYWVWYRSGVDIKGLKSFCLGVFGYLSPYCGGFFWDIRTISAGRWISDKLQFLRQRQVKIWSSKTKAGQDMNMCQSGKSCLKLIF